MESFASSPEGKAFKDAKSSKTGTKYDMEKHNISNHRWKKPECTVCHNRKDG